MSDNHLTKKYKSILDYNPPYDSILSKIGPEIEFSISSLLKNATIKTYFDMLSLEFYNYEFNQLLELNNLKLKDESTKILNLTVLELIYNLVYQIMLRKWKFSSYIIYDMHIIPVRIQKYVKALNYELKKYKISAIKEVYRLVPSTSKHATIIINKFTHAQFISGLFESFRICSIDEVEDKLIYFKEIVNFLKYTWPICENTFGKEFTHNLRSEIDKLNNIEIKKIKETELKLLVRKMEKIVNVSMMIFLLMVDNMESGAWEDIVKEQKIKNYKKEAEEELARINDKIAKLNIEDFEKKIIEKNKLNELGHLKLNKIKQPEINLNNPISNH